MYENSEFEEVYTIDDWYDGPRTGFAQYRGKPHHYRSLYLDYDDWDADEDRYELIAVSADVLAAAVEADSIYSRWTAARQRGEVAWAVNSPKSEFGALPEDRGRYAITRSVIVPYAEPGHPEGFIVRGRFDLANKRVQWRDDS
jgi:hypothetical protein